MSAAAIARLKITLDDMEPAVIRRVETSFDIRLDRLHLLIQAAMGWTNSHLYEIRVGDVGWGIPDPGWPDGPLDARKARLAAVIEDVGTRTLRYIYDFGDGWEHHQDRAPRRSRAGRRLSAADRGERPLPSRRCWRPLGLWRASRSDRRSEARTPRRVQGVDRRRLRSACRRCQMARRRGRRPREKMVAQASLQALAPCLTAVLTGWSHFVNGLLICTAVSRGTTPEAYSAPMRLFG